MTKAKKVTKTKEETKFTKEQILAGKRLAGSKDLLNAILDPKKTYTLAEVEEEINNYYKRKVK